MNSTKRKEIEDYVLKFMSTLDVTGKNTERYQEFFKSLDSNKNFESWLKYFLNNDKEHFQVQALPFEEPKISQIKKTADWMGVPLEEYMYYRHDDDKDNPVKTATPIPVGYIHIKRMQQILSKKNNYTFDADKRDAKTGQTIGESKVARLSDHETFALTTIGADNALKEFLSSRSDHEGNKLQMYKNITQDGYFKLSDLEDKVGQSTTLNTIDAYLTSAGVMTDLVTPGLKTLTTLKKDI
jgi:hypothetical protein